MPVTDQLLILLGNLIVGAGNYGKFRGSGGATIFAEAGWSVTCPCPATGWEPWASDELEQFLTSDSRAIEKVLLAMAAPTEFLDKTNRIDQKGRHNQIAIWNGFLAPHGLSIRADSLTVQVEAIRPTYLSTENDATMASSSALSPELSFLVEALRKHGDRCVFIMVQFGASNWARDLIEHIKRALGKFGLRGFVAGDMKFSDLVWRNVQAYMHGCCAGIAVFDRIETDQHNANVALEAGYMIALNKPVCFLKERTVKGLQADLAGHLWYPFDLQRVESVDLAVEQWLRHDRLI